jgi:acylphosphatase
MIRRRVIVHGHVQGVWFRGSTQEAARAAGVSGWVRNRPGGTVEAVFEGDAAAVERLLDFCRLGPRLARVECVEVREETPQGLQGFAVR